MNNACVLSQYTCKSNRPGHSRSNGRGTSETGKFWECDYLATEMGYSTPVHCINVFRRCCSCSPGSTVPSGAAAASSCCAGCSCAGRGSGSSSLQHHNQRHKSLAERQWKREGRDCVSLIPPGCATWPEWAVPTRWLDRPEAGGRGGGLGIRSVIGASAKHGLGRSHWRRLRRRRVERSSQEPRAGRATSTAVKRP